MLPTRASLARTEGRSTPLRIAPRQRGRLLAVLAPAALLAGLPWTRVSADPLPLDPVEELRQLLAEEPRLPPATQPAIAVLAQRRQHLEETARKLHFLGDVGRALLLPEWRNADRLDRASPGLPEQIDPIVHRPDSERFQQDLTNLLQRVQDKDREDALRMAAAAIDHSVRLLLLEHWERGLRSCLESGRPAEEIAAAEWIGAAMIDVRRQENLEAQAAGVESDMPCRRVPSGSTGCVRRHLRTLAGNLGKLTREARDPEVQAAAARALGELEADPETCVAALQPLLEPSRPVLVRRAVAGAIGTTIATVVGLEKRDPNLVLRTAERALPVVSGSLADPDAQVRRLCLNACRQIAAALKEMISEQASKGPPGGLAAYRPLMATVQKDLPRLERGVLDPVPGLRVAACRVLEDLALAAQMVRNEEAMPAVPKASPTNTAPGTPVALTPETPGRGRYVEDGGLRVASFVVPKPEQRPQPLPVELSLGGTVPALGDSLRHPDPRVRLAALDVLETLCVENGSQPRVVPAIPALVQAVCDPNKTVRWEAARTLGRLGKTMPRLAPQEVKPAVHALMTRFHDQEDLGVRTAAAVALECFGPEARDAVPLLAQVLPRGDREYRIAVLHALQGIGTEARPALPAVGWLLRNDTNAGVRIVAVRVLGHFGQLAVNQVPALRIAWLRDPDAEVRQAARSVLLAVDPTQAR
jgi:HEAT repeat protein